MLRSDVLGRRGAHLRARLLVRGEQLERRRKRVDLERIDGDLQRDLVRKLREPAHVGDDEWASGHERSDRAARGLPHRRRSQRDHNVAAGHQRPQAVLVDVVLPDDADEVTLAEPGLEGEARSRRPDHEQAGVGMRPPDRAERLDELRDALRRRQVAEAADDRAPRDRNRRRPRPLPGWMRDPPEPPFVACGANALLDVARVDDQSAAGLRCVLENLADERKVLGSNLPERRYDPVDDTVRQQPPRHARVTLHRAQVTLRIAAPERHARDQVVEHEVVEDHDARPPSQRFDDPPVRIGVVAHVVEAHVADGSPPSRPDLDVEPALQSGQEQRAVLRDPGPLRGKRREVIETQLIGARVRLRSPPGGSRRNGESAEDSHHARATIA
jgi:hypothetical protein